MPIVDLTPSAEHADQIFPTRFRIGLDELALLVHRAGGHRLPFATEPDAATHDEETARIHARLSGGEASLAEGARDRINAALERGVEEDPQVDGRLRESGLVDTAGTPLAEALVALGALAAPEVLLVVDVSLETDHGRDRLRSWVAVGGDRVVQLSTLSAVDFELGWYDLAHLPDVLARAATVDADASESAEDDEDDADPLPGLIELPYELFTDGTEAVRRRREDLLAELVRIAPGPILADGRSLDAARSALLISRLENQARGRLRVLVTAPRPDEAAQTVGVVSWLFSNARWWSLTPRRDRGVATLVLRRVGPRDLTTAVAPLLAGVV